MLQTRVIPCLLLKDQALVKTRCFKNPSYIGDPINAVRIFNEMQVDELIFLDISATTSNSPPPFELISEIASECFMPFAYGGGVTSLEQMKRIYSSGAEKIILNTAAIENPQLVQQAAQVFGSQSLIGSIDVKKGMFGKKSVYTRCGTLNTKLTPEEVACQLIAAGVGEIFVNSIDRDGTWQGYDLELIQQITKVCSVPVIACGGAGSIEDLGLVVKQAHASAAAVGSMVVYQGKDLGVLINFPQRSALRAIFNE